jgi:hypothetical protein
MRSSNGPLNAENVIACVIVICSSSSAMYSSMPLRMHVPVARYSSTWSGTLCHAASIVSRLVSIENSLPAISEIFVMMSRLSASLSSNTSDSVYLGPGRTALPALAETSSQWRSRMPGWRSATMSGTCGRNSATWSKISFATLVQPSSLWFSKYFIERCSVR